MRVCGSGDVRRRRLPCRSGKAVYWRAALPPGHATTFAAARWRRAHRGPRRGTSSCRYRCRSRRSQYWVSETWRAPCLWRPLPASLAGGAGARPDHPISRPCADAAGGGLENKFVEHVVLAVRRSTGCRRSRFGCGWSSQCDWILRRLAMTISHRFIETNGIRMHLAEAGSGPTVLLCHGFPECWYSWRHQLEALAAAGYRAIAPDMRGYGQTDKPDAIDQYTLLHLTGDMVGLLDAIGTDQAVVVGHDWGAPVAWRCAG